MSHTQKVELIAHVLQTMEDIHKRVAHACPLETYDITPLQLGALKYLYETSESTAGSLGEHLCLSSSATTQLGERLVLAGLIKRDTHPSDRRIVMLSLTQKGKKMCARLLEEQKQGMIALFEQLSEKDLENMANIIKRLYATITNKQ